MKQHSKTRVAASAVLIGFGALLFYACNEVGDGFGLDENGNIPVAPPAYTLPTRYFKDSVQMIFKDANCTGCHTPGGSGYEDTGGDSEGGLDLEIAPYASLIGPDGTGVPAFEHRENPDTIPLLRVKPGFPDSSYLVHKISKDNPGFGVRMPFGGQLDSNQIAVIRKWIEYGAPLGDTTTLTVP